jgi:hypothetical protein
VQDVEAAGLEIEVVEGGLDELRAADTGIEEDEEDGPVPGADRAGGSQQARSRATSSGEKGRTILWGRRTFRRDRNGFS